MKQKIFTITAMLLMSTSIVSAQQLKTKNQYISDNLVGTETLPTDFIVCDRTTNKCAFSSGADFDNTNKFMNQLSDDLNPTLNGALLVQEPSRFEFNLPDISEDIEGVIGVETSGGGIEIVADNNIFDAISQFVLHSKGNVYIGSPSAFEGADVRIGDATVIDGRTVYPLTFYNPPTPSHSQIENNPGPTPAIGNAGVGTQYSVIPSFLIDFDYQEGATALLTATSNNSGFLPGTIYFVVSVNGSPVTTIPYSVGTGTSDVSISRVLSNYPSIGDTFEVTVWGDTGNSGAFFSATLSDMELILQQPGSGGGGGGGDLGTITTTTTVTITNTEGSNALISQATGTDAGVMTVAHHDKLESIADNADVTGPANVTAAGALMSQGTNALVIVSDTQSNSFTPVYTACQVAEVTISSGTGNFTLNAPSGTAPTGYYECVYSIKNESAETRTIVFGSINKGTDKLTSFALPDGTSTKLTIYTEDSGTTWRYDGGVLDLSSLPANTLPAADDLVLCQDVSDAPSTWKHCTVDQLGGSGGGGPINDTDVFGSHVDHVDTLTVTADDHGKTIVCNKATAMAINVDAGTTDWSPDFRVYVLNEGVGDCVIQDGPSADINVKTASGFTTTVQTNSGATIIGNDAASVTVTGGKSTPGGGGASTDSDIVGNHVDHITDVIVTAEDHGKTIVCDNGSGMFVNVDDGVLDWTPDYRVYVLNIGAGVCTIRDGSNVDVTIQTATGFTADVPQYGGVTIIGKDTDEVVVTGGAAQ